jgi:hypothetical protein
MGTYTVNVVDGSSCVSSATVAITEPAALSATSTHSNASCGGICDGAITAFPSGGTSPYSHKWTTSPVQTGATATGLCAGIYKDSITDANGCKTVLGPITVTQPVPVAALVTCGGVSCNGGNNGTSSVTASGGSPAVSGYTYSWSTSPTQTTATATGLSAGNYTCTVTDSLGCTGKGNCTVNQPTVFTYSASSTDASCATCCDGAASSAPSGGTTPYSYAWNPGGQTTQNISGVCPGNYTVCITDAHGCIQSSCSSVSVNYATGMNELPTGVNEIYIFPNPSTGKFDLQLLNNSPHSMKIINPLGESVFEDNKITSMKTEFDLSALPNGVYCIAVTSSNGTSNKKIVLNK